MRSAPGLVDEAIELAGCREKRRRRLPARRARQCERIKKPPKNTFTARKPGHPRPPGKVSYTITLTPTIPRPAQTPQITSIAV